MQIIWNVSIDTASFFSVKLIIYGNLFPFRFRLVPFLTELRAVMDWVWTDTTLSLSSWICVEDIYAHIFILKCWRESEKVRDLLSIFILFYCCTYNQVRDISKCTILKKIHNTNCSRHNIYHCMCLVFFITDFCWCFPFICCFCVCAYWHCVESPDSLAASRCVFPSVSSFPLCLLFFYLPFVFSLSVWCPHAFFSPLFSPHSRLLVCVCLSLSTCASPFLTHIRAFN